MRKDSAFSVGVSDWPRGEEAGEAELGGVQNRNSWGDGDREGEGEEERSGGDRSSSPFRGKRAASSSF